MCILPMPEQELVHVTRVRHVINGKRVLSLRKEVYQSPPSGYPAMSADNTLYFEDIEVGLTRDCGSITAEKEEMLEFAERFDPQPIHTDEEAARESIFGELIASGWYTASLAARLLVKGYMNDTATRGGRGMDDLRWH